VDALEYIQTNHIVHHSIRPETIIFTENVGNLKLIDVGFDQYDHLTHDDTSRDIYDFGVVLNEVLSHLPEKNPQLQRVASRCVNPDPRRRYHDIQDLKMALTNRSNQRLYFIIITFLVVMIALLGWLVANPRY
jgi:serine/threonine protein kinase